MKLIWDCLHHGFNFNDTHVTYNPEQAKQYSDEQASAIAADDVHRRFMVLNVPQDNSNHPCDQILTVEYAHMVEITEEDCAGTKILTKNGETYAFLAEIGLIETETDLGEKWYFEYRHNRYGRIKLELADHEHTIWEMALHHARKRMKSSGDRPTYSMFAYLRARKARGMDTDMSTPFDIALNNAPTCQ